MTPAFRRTDGKNVPPALFGIQAKKCGFFPAPSDVLPRHLLWSVMMMTSRVMSGRSQACASGSLAYFYSHSWKRETSVCMSPAPTCQRIQDHIGPQNMHEGQPRSAKPTSKAAPS